MSALVFALGAGAAAGVVLLVVALRPVPADQPERASTWPRWARRVAVAAGVGLVVALLTRWPVAALLGAAAVLGGPAVWGNKRALDSSRIRGEAVAAWAEMIRDTMVAGAGLEQAITRTALVAPAPILAEVTEMAARLEGREPAEVALRGFAEALADPTADLVVAALIEAADKPVRNLGPLLGALATSAREQAASYIRIQNERKSVVSTVRLVVGVTLGLAAFLAVFSRSYLSPYDDALGQSVLAIIGVVFALAFWLLAQLARISGPERFLGPRAAEDV